MSNDHLPQLVHERILTLLQNTPSVDPDEAMQAADEGMDAVLSALSDDRPDLTVADMESMPGGR